MKKQKFSVGMRVAFYQGDKRVVCRVSFTGEPLTVQDVRTGYMFYAHEKQCRRIVKKKKPNFECATCKAPYETFKELIQCEHVNPAPVAKAREYTSDKVDIVQHTSFEVEKRVAREFWLQVDKFPFNILFKKPEYTDGWLHVKEVLDEPTKLTNYNFCDQCKLDISQGLKKKEPSEGGK